MTAHSKHPREGPDGSNCALEGQPAQESHPNACSALMRWVCACELTRAQRIPASNIQTLGETSTGSKCPGQKLHPLPATLLKLLTHKEGSALHKRWSHEKTHSIFLKTQMLSSTLALAKKLPSRQTLF